jgi:streptomycin 6-kinase
MRRPPMRLRKVQMPDDLPEVVLHNGFMLPDELKRRLSLGVRDTSPGWLASLPDVVRSWCEARRITLAPEVPTLSYNLVLFGSSPDLGQVVLKVAPPHPEVTSEIEAMRAVTGPGLVRLIDADPSVAIALMERIVPGTPLKTRTDNGEIGDEEATRIAAGEMRKMWVEPPMGHHLFPLDRWFAALFDYRRDHAAGGPLPHHLVELAIAQANDVLATQRECVVLHGDVHHDNILADAEHGWSLIDFKGLVGERGYDIGTWMLNPPGIGTWPNLQETVERRRTIFAEELGIERERLWQWAMVHAVLSICWTLEEGPQHWDGDIAVAQALATIHPFSRR